MGYNTVMMLINDNMNIGAKDPEIGKRIQHASRYWGPNKHGLDLDITAFGKEGESGSYGSIISQAHADDYQVTITHGNMGWQIDDAENDKYIGEPAFRKMIKCLERNGYRVTKNRKNIK